MKSQDIYSAINYAIDAANDDGYLNHFVFVRALDVALATIEYPLDVEINENDNVFDIYDKLKDKGIVDKIRYDVDMADIYDQAHTEYYNYQQHLDSFGGSMNTFMDFMNAKFSQGISELKEKINSEDIERVQTIAENWGLDNALPQEV